MNWCSYLGQQLIWMQEKDGVQKEDESQEVLEEAEKEEPEKPIGTLILDATCCLADIHYPTDVG